MTTSFSVVRVHGTLPVFDDPAIRDRSLVGAFERVRTVSGNALPEQESVYLHDRRTVPAPGSPCHEAAFPDCDTRPSAKAGTGNNGRGVLLAPGGKEHALPPQLRKRTPEARR